MHLLLRYRSSNFYRIFNFRDEMAKGRVSMLASSVIVQAMLPLTSGVFYTGFLIANDINIVNANLICFIPQIAGLLSVFSPYLLEKFAKRKKLLLYSRLIYYILNILGVTVLPLIVHDTRAKLIGFGIILFISSAVSALTTPGFSPWHLNYIPDDTRVDYFGYNQVVRCTVYGIVILLSGYVADSLSGSSYETTVLYALRIIAFLMAVTEIIFLALPTEPSYERKEPPKLKNIFTLSFRHKRFFRVIMIIAAWTFFMACSSSSLNYYLLNTAKVPYTYMGFMDALYPLFLFVFAGYWRRYIKRSTWLRTFAVNAFLYTPTMLLYSFVTSGNYLVLMTIVRLAQHFSGVGLNHSFSNLPFINMPDEDRTNYTAFHTLAVTAATMLGTLFGTAFVAATQNADISIFGMPYTSPQMLMVIQFIGQTATAVCILVFRSRLEPENELSKIKEQTAVNK